jgi:hypothetical protein
MSIYTQKFMEKIEPRPKIMYKGRDGRSDASLEALRQADEAWKQRNLFYIVHDAEQGRREIAPGTGKVRVCVGHFIETDPTSGKKKYVPAYREQTF